MTFAQKEMYLWAPKVSHILAYLTPYIHGLFTFLIVHYHSKYKLVYCRLQKRLRSLKIFMIIEHDFSYIVALINTMKCKQTMCVGGLCRLKHGLLWVPISTFLFAQMSPNLARSIVRCYSSSCEILMSMQ